MNWSEKDIPSQAGRTAIITGANSGLGFCMSRVLALNGARVIMACRNLEKGEQARQKILEENPGAVLEVWQLDLAQLSSVQSFAGKCHSTYNSLDLLINNAGRMAIPYMRTGDGFEMQFGVSHLGHFALTARLWPVLRSTPGSRVVNVSSAVHHVGRIRFRDIHWERKYRKWGAYGMSKLANLLFTKELARRLLESESGVTVTAAHPGYADTSLHTNGMMTGGARLKAASFKLANRLAAQTAEKGALSILYAAVAPGVEQGDFYGPGGFLRLWGSPAPERPNSRRVNDMAARELWKVSETLTGMEFQIH